MGGFDDSVRNQLSDRENSDEDTEDARSSDDAVSDRAVWGGDV